MEEHKTPLEDKKVFRYSAGGIALFVFACLLVVMVAFGAIGRDETRNLFMITIGIIFCGGGGIYFLVFKSWRPIVTVSKEGISQPTLLKEKFVSWVEINEIRIKVQSISSGRGFTTTTKYIGVFTFEGRQEDNAFGYFWAELSKFLTGWSEMPTLLIANQKILTGIKNEEIIQIMEKYHEEFVSGLPEEEKAKYEHVFRQNVTRLLKNTMNFVGEDNSIQEDVDQENINLENMNAPPKVSDQIDWEKLSVKDEGSGLEQTLRRKKTSVINVFKSASTSEETSAGGNVITGKEKEESRID